MLTWVTGVELSAQFSAGLEPGEPCVVLAQLCRALEYLLMFHVRR